MNLRNKIVVLHNSEELIDLAVTCTNYFPSFESNNWKDHVFVCHTQFHHHNLFIIFHWNSIVLSIHVYYFLHSVILDSLKWLYRFCYNFHFRIYITSGKQILSHGCYACVIIHIQIFCFYYSFLFSMSWQNLSRLPLPLLSYYIL